MGITGNDLAATTERLVGANGGKIKMDGIVFLNLTVGNATSSQLVYMTPKVTSFFLSLRACKELCAVHPNFPAHTTEIGQNQRNATDSDNNNGPDFPIKPET